MRSDGMFHVTNQERQLYVSISQWMLYGYTRGEEGAMGAKRQVAYVCVYARVRLCRPASRTTVIPSLQIPDPACPAAASSYTSSSLNRLLASANFSPSPASNSRPPLSPPRPHPSSHSQYPPPASSAHRPPTPPTSPPQTPASSRRGPSSPPAAPSSSPAKTPRRKAR